MLRKLPFRVSLPLLGALCCCVCSLPAWASAEVEVELNQRVDQLAAEVARLRAQLETQSSEARGAETGARATVLGSYGEIQMTRPLHLSTGAQADLRRLVLGLQHRYDERTRVVAELELEHAVASAEDPGEVAVEQAYLERQATPWDSWRAGLFLMPMGLLNENHEPTAFYGVERNAVETAIIPSTWREGGLQWLHTTDEGLTLQGGVSTSFDLGRWDGSSSEGRASPLGSVHQELALARARDLAWFAAARWRGSPGWLWGASVFIGGASQGQAPTGAKVSLWDAHVRWTPGAWDVSALVSQGQISHTAALNAVRLGQPTQIPSRFGGAYAQVAYRLWSSGDAVLAPFLRLERYNTASAYADLGPGLTPAPAETQAVATVGANLQLTPGVVLKADLRRSRSDSTLDRYALGLGWSF